MPGPDSAASCYLIEAAATRFFLDLGSGALGPLQHYVDLALLDAGLFSHLHADHVLDVCALYVASRYGPYTRSAPLPLYGPKALADRAASAYGLHSAQDLADLRASFDFRTVGEGTFAIGPVEVTARRVEHPVEAYAYRLSHEGTALAYSGDCAPCAGLEEVAAGADLLLVEAGYGDGAGGPPGIHHTAAEAGQLAARAGVGRLVVTHVPPWLSRETAALVAGEQCTVPVVAATPGAVFEV
jgi:ribonuclease BN (tRNA processing enzyme)